MRGGWRSRRTDYTRPKRRLPRGHYGVINPRSHEAKGQGAPIHEPPTLGHVSAVEWKLVPRRQHAAGEKDQTNHDDLGKLIIITRMA